VSACQHGDRLGQYKVFKDGKVMFKESRFTMILLTADGEYVGHSDGNPRFLYSYIKKSGVLKAGDYFLFVDCCWNETTAFDKDYMRVTIDVFTTSACSKI